MSTTRQWAACALAAVVLGMSACGSGSSTSSATTATSAGGAEAGTGPVKVQQRDFKLTLASTALKAGSVTFDIKNSGPSAHELVVFRTDLAAGKLPTDSNGDVKEGDAALEKLSTTGEIKAGKSRSVTIDLAPGNYVAVCNLSGHYAAGMHAAFTVTG